MLGGNFMVPKETPSSSSAGTMPSLFAEAFSMMSATSLYLENAFSLLDEGLRPESRREATAERARGKGGAGVFCWDHCKWRSCLAIAISVLSMRERGKLKVGSIWCTLDRVLR